MNTVQTEYGSIRPAVTLSKVAGVTEIGNFSKRLQAMLSAPETRQAEQTAPRSAEEYKKYLEKRFGPVTLESVGKDQESLDAVGKRMRGNDVYIAPNIFDKMVNDPETGDYYEKKISYFFTDVIPNGTAYAKSIGLTFEPCGVVIHEDGTVTYICGGGDPPEKVAKVAAENQAKREKQSKRRKELFELSAERALLQRALWEQAIQAAANRSRTLESVPASDGTADFGEMLKIRSLTGAGVSEALDMSGDHIFYHIM